MRGAGDEGQQGGIQEQLLRQSRLASERLVEIGRLEEALERSKLRVQELDGGRGAGWADDGGMSVQAFQDQLRMRNSVINCLQKEIAVLKKRGVKTDKDVSRMRPLEASLLTAKARTQIMQSAYDRIYQQEASILPTIVCILDSLFGEVAVCTSCLPPCLRRSHLHYVVCCIFTPHAVRPQSPGVWAETPPIHWVMENSSGLQCPSGLVQNGI